MDNAPLSCCMPMTVVVSDDWLFFTRCPSLLSTRDKSEGATGGPAGEGPEEPPGERQQPFSFLSPLPLSLPPPRPLSLSLFLSLLQVMRQQYEDKMTLLQTQIRSVESERDKVLKDIGQWTERERGREICCRDELVVVVDVGSYSSDSGSMTME